jgi:hypothetical protein
MVVHPGCSVVLGSVHAMKRFTTWEQIVSVLVLTLAATAWPSRAWKVGSPPLKPLLAAGALSVAGVALVEQWAGRKAGNTLADLPMGTSQSGVASFQRGLQLPWRLGLRRESRMRIKMTAEPIGVSSWRQISDLSDKARPGSARREWRPESGRQTRGFVAWRTKRLMDAQ